MVCAFVSQHLAELKLDLLQHAYVHHQALDPWAQISYVNF